MGTPAIDPTEANPLWRFVCDSKERIENRLKHETLHPDIRKRLERELTYWGAIEALVDRWLKGREQRNEQLRG